MRKQAQRATHQRSHSRTTQGFLLSPLPTTALGCLSLLKAKGLLCFSYSHHWCQECYCVELSSSLISSMCTKTQGEGMNSYAQAQGMHRKSSNCPGFKSWCWHPSMCVTLATPLLLSEPLSSLFSKFNLIFFWLHLEACGILIPWPGIKPRPLAVREQNPNHRTAREFPCLFFKICRMSLPGGPTQNVKKKWKC